MNKLSSPTDTQSNLLDSPLHQLANFLLRHGPTHREQNCIQNAILKLPRR